VYWFFISRLKFRVFETYKWVQIEYLLLYLLLDRKVDLQLTVSALGK
jgi:hypothetical protein